MTSEWKEEFFRIYFDDNADSKLKEEQLNIKNENIPEFLYQYQNTRHIDDILENNFMYPSWYILIDSSDWWSIRIYLFLSTDLLWQWSETVFSFL